ncbi:hypothetical protein Tco_1217307 [Tanacetum coccineum]
MDTGLQNKQTIIPSLTELLQHSVRIDSNIITRQDGRVQSYCGLRLRETPLGLSGPMHLRPVKKRTNKMAYTSAAVPVTYHNIGHPSHQCRNGNATIWYEEREEKLKNAVNPTFSLCCQGGKLVLLHFNNAPPPLNHLLNHNDTLTVKFRDQIRVYNSMFSFTSFGARIDHSINTGRNEVRNRTGAFIDKETSKGVDEQIVASLIQIERKTTRHYNAPTMSEVAALIVNDFEDGLPTRDIIVNSKDNDPKRISELHPSYMALQYPLLFPYVEDGFHDKIPGVCHRIPKAGPTTCIYPPMAGRALQMQDTQQKPSLMKKATHIIEEGTIRSKAIKYLFKYLNKGPDRATIVVEENVKNGTTVVREKVLEVDEIKNYLNCRFLAPYEAVWRLFSFDIHYSYPTVMQLSFHLPNQKAITLRDSEKLPALLRKEGIDVTIFTNWFELNKRDPTTRAHTYAEIPEHYVWHEKDKL